MSDIQRYESTPRLSRVVVHNGIVHLAGITSAVRDGDIIVQTKSVLDTIAARLASVGSSKEKILSAQIWLKDIDRDFAGLNTVWEAWVPADAVPTRATCEAKLAAPELLVEIIVTAAL
ncbi:RidA family protein [Polaromonas sp. JS666]|uniref:RidA family protein n=1 Tax=Polaromonas sp. (strain JS666 / ATCC BAA-500) TaxID=296591 RepID=UPI0000464882|nr:RidA family protein [Polaromonas sp. JS666]ABE46261.1 Endoribonuclease L-PSP [Polaromonas sp. JS666]